MEKQIKTLARDNHGHFYPVKLFAEEGEAGKMIVQIGTTPGRWYLSTLMEKPYSQTRIAIDIGQNWYCINFHEIMSEVIKVI